MKLDFVQLIRDARRLDEAWISMPWSDAERRAQVTFLESTQGAPLTGASVPHDIQVLIESTLREEDPGDPGDVGATPTWTKTAPGRYRHSHNGHSISISENHQAWRHHDAAGKILASGADTASLHAHLKSGGFPLLAIGTSSATEGKECPSGHDVLRSVFRDSRSVFSAARTLTEDRSGERSFADLSADERQQLYRRLATGDPDIAFPRLRAVLNEVREEKPTIPEGSHRRLAEALGHAAPPSIPADAHAKLAAAFGR